MPLSRCLQVMGFHLALFLAVTPKIVETKGFRQSRTVDTLCALCGARRAVLDLPRPHVHTRYWLSHCIGCAHHLHSLHVRQQVGAGCRAGATLGLPSWLIKGSSFATVLLQYCAALISLYIQILLVKATRWTHILYSDLYSRVFKKLNNFRWMQS